MYWTVSFTVEFIVGNRAREIRVIDFLVDFRLVVDLSRHERWEKIRHRRESLTARVERERERRKKCVKGFLLWFWGRDPLFWVLLPFKGFVASFSFFLIQIRLLNLNRFWTVHSPVSSNSGKDGPFNFIWFNNKEHMQVISFYWCPVQSSRMWKYMYYINVAVLVVQLVKQTKYVHNQTYHRLRVVL